MTITAEARATLTGALRTACAPWAVTDTPPADPAVPCVYVDLAERQMTDDDGAPVVVVTFPVVALVDGGDAEQVRALDDVGDLVWRTMLELHAYPTSARVREADVGGPRLRALVTLCDVPVDHLTLCPPEEAP